MKKMIKWLDPLRTAWTGVVTHKLRSFLTMLGIVIGVGAVITLMSVGKGSTAQILSNIQSMGVKPDYHSRRRIHVSAVSGAPWAAVIR